MKKIFVQNTDNKFINNLTNTKIDNYTIAHGNSSNILYKIQSQHNFDIYFFPVSMLTREIIQFVIEFRHKIKIFLYHDIKGNQEIMDQYGSLFFHVVENDNYTFSNMAIIPKNLVNTDLYQRYSDLTKDESIIFFLDGLGFIPPSIEKLLYPNSSLKIKLFNNELLVHPQNLGRLQEIDKVYVLNKATYFISNDGYYEFEAATCGCKIIDINNVDINQAKIIDPKITTYTEFLNQIL